MKTDTLDRRLRFAPPNPVVARIALTPRDHLIFAAIDRHGPLPAHYLFELTKQVARSYKHLQYRLTELYNGDATGAYLTRPSQQFAAFEARYQHLVYDLAPRARRALADEGRLIAFPPTGSAWFLHQLMQACAGASIELATAGSGFRYVGRDEVLRHDGMGEGRAANNPMALPLAAGRHLTPDDLFALENAEGRKRYFIVEVDRATESMAPSGVDRNELGKKTTYFGKKLASYIDVLKAGTVMRWWGFSKPRILIITTNQGRADHILSHLKAMGQPACASLFHIAVVPSFGANWRVPKEPLAALFTEPWMTVAGPRRITDA